MGKKISDYIRLFPKDQSFTSDPKVLNLSNKIGICILDGIISAKISEEINGAYEATIEYDMDNQWFKEIKKDRLIVMRVDPYESKPAQIFRIYSISRNLIGNTATIIAKHISYDLSNYIVLKLNTDFRPIGGSHGLISDITSKRHSDFPFLELPFNIETDNLDNDRYIEFGVSEPRSIRNIIGDGENSILEKYGKVSEIDDIDQGPKDKKLDLDSIQDAWEDYLENGSSVDGINYEIEYNNFNVMIHTHGRGQRIGMTIRYGSNMTDYSDESKNDEMYTHLFPYFKNEQTEEAEEIGIDGSVEDYNNLPPNFNLSPHYVKTYDVYRVVSQNKYYIAKQSETEGVIDWVMKTDQSTLIQTLPYSFNHVPLTARGKIEPNSQGFFPNKFNEPPYYIQEGDVWYNHVGPGNVWEFEIATKGAPYIESGETKYSISWNNSIHTPIRNHIRFIDGDVVPAEYKSGTTVKLYDIKKLKITEDEYQHYIAKPEIDQNGKIIPNSHIIRWEATEETSNNVDVYMDIIHNDKGEVMAYHGTELATKEDMLIPTRTDSPDPDAENAYVKILPYDCTSDWQNEWKYKHREIPSNYEIMKLGQKYIKNNNLTDRAKVSMKVSFEQVMDDPEMVELFETVHLGDYVNVYVAKLGVNREAEVVKTEYDVLANRYTSIEIGEKFKDLTSRMIR